MAVIRAYSMCASGVEKCAQTLLRTVLARLSGYDLGGQEPRALERPVLDLVKHYGSQADAECVHWLAHGGQLRARWRRRRRRQVRRSDDIGDSSIPAPQHMLGELA